MTRENGHLPLVLPVRDAIERHAALTGQPLTEDDLRMIGREAAVVLKTLVKA